MTFGQVLAAAAVFRPLVEAATLASQQFELLTGDASVAAVLIRRDAFRKRTREISRKGIFPSALQLVRQDGGAPPDLAKPRLARFSRLSHPRAGARRISCRGSTPMNTDRITMQ